jgi:hypothetical protein
LINFKEKLNEKKKEEHEQGKHEEEHEHPFSLDYPVSDRRKVVENHIINYIDKESSIHKYHNHIG